MEEGAPNGTKDDQDRMVRRGHRRELDRRTRRIHRVSSVDEALRLARQNGPAQMSFDMTLILSIRAPGEARRSLESVYATTMDRALLDDVKLMASELVANAVQHSGRPEGDPLSLSCTVVDNVLRVAIGDHGTTVDHLRPRSMHPPSGLGLVGLLSDHWSSYRDGALTVWFEINITPHTTLTRSIPIHIARERHGPGANQLETFAALQPR